MAKRQKKDLKLNFVDRIQIIKYTSCFHTKTVFFQFDIKARKAN